MPGLAKRLGHADQRVRLDAQWELAARKKWELLQTIAKHSAAPQLARIHALWGLSQGKQFDEALFTTLTTAKDPEIRAQAEVQKVEIDTKSEATNERLRQETAQRDRDADLTLKLLDYRTKVIEYVQRMQKEFAVTFAKAACKRDNTLVATPAFQKWAMSNSSLMAAIA